MRVVIGFLFLLFGFSAAFASKAKPVFEMRLKGHYSSQETQVFKEGRVWFCKTELTPYYETRQAPFDLKELESLQKAASDRKVASHCRDQVFIIDRHGKSVKDFAGCLDEDQALRAFAASINKNCGR